MKSAPTVRSLILLFAGSALASAAILFQENFITQGTRLDTKVWTTEVGSPSYLGRTQLADWVSSGATGQFIVGPRGAQLTLSTYNPTGLSLYGTHAKTLAAFQPAASTSIEFTSRLQLTSLRPGLVYGIYLYGCPGPCATRHDELDIEILTNSLQPGAPLQVQLNRFADEPLGAGHGGLVNLPAKFDPLAAHDWTIRWSRTRVDYLVDGTLLGSATTVIPQGPMQVNEIAWGPEKDWAAAYSASLQPVPTQSQAQVNTAYLTSVIVAETSAAPRIAAFLNAASGQQGVGAVNSWMTSFGESLATETAVASGAPFPETLAGVQVLVGSTPAPLWYVSPTQINFLMPTVNAGSTTLLVKNLITGRQSDPVVIQVDDAVPGVFLSGGFAIIQDEFGQLVTAAEGMNSNRIYVLYGTGFGPVTPTIRLNEPPTIASRLTLPCRLSIADTEAEILYAGVTPGAVGLYQLNFRNKLPTGSLRTVSARLTVGLREVTFPVSVR